ncbi:LmeA family phospholipid-binding protein [Microbacterium sp.]|uniref:LmeA family phospholipid-binding protein n=1 Tax=Microbacterium sp. TaxID=51671 RepID=UPI0028117239|nr:LmeA family phospholipid-binding protein [Microbacterium sp.]
MSAARRARWPWVLLILAVVLATLVVAAELVARAVVPGVVRSVVIDQLDLPSDQQMHVEASGLLLPQLAVGRLDELHLTSDRVTIGGVTGSADVTATGVPLQGGALDRAHGTVAIEADQFLALVEPSDLPVEGIEFQEPDVTVSGTVEVFGLALPLGLTVTPGADGGELLLTPVSASVAGELLDLQELSDRFGGLGRELVETRRICIADQLPAGITLTGLRIEGTRAVADIAADGRIAVDPALLENGTC